ncbi:O-antigen ligase [Roseivivax lentus]|uniref:O-antigen ligase n=1 Tax=Roseivivax lentus TaxID=633194 RepID=A0A1N7P8M5_9RHOB|nr:O-antigen ligase family protein [Roseivivax lentus]SIT06887.1 O-antigen ligase [Roseivivax lentus]
MANIIEAAHPQSAVGTRFGRPTWPVTLLLLSLAVPFFFPIGPLLLTADRIVLLGVFLPCLIIWLRGGAGPKILPDYALLLYCLWMSLSTFIRDGPSVATESAGINLIETFGAYLVGRCLVRDADGFFALARLLFLMILVMLPFAIHESLTGRNILLEFANRVWPSYADVMKEPRWGLDRVALTFYHPILYGTFCGACFGISYYVLGHKSSPFMRAFRPSLVGLSIFLSLSSGPITAMVAQLGLILWDRVLAGFKKRWLVLVSGVSLLWTGLAIAANRSVPELFLTYFAFNPATAYNRIRIWEFGVINVKQNPILGTGITGDWFRPWWMSGSMDMFWLVPAVKYGLPAGILMHVAFLGMFVMVMLKKGLSERAQTYRTGILISLVGFYLAGWTVHYWKVVYVLFLLLLGASSWLLTDTARPIPDDKAGDVPRVKNHLNLTRRAIPNGPVGSNPARQGGTTGRYSRFSARGGTGR